MTDIADIAKSVRSQLKEHYKDCTFSVTIHRFAGGQSLAVGLMSSPFDVFEPDFEGNDWAIEHGRAQLFHGNFANKDSRISNGYQLTEKAWNVMSGASIIALAFHRQGQSSPGDDYGPWQNFYLHINIGSDSTSKPWHKR